MIVGHDYLHFNIKEIEIKQQRHMRESMDSSYF